MDDRVGLFGYAVDATIKNLSIVNCNVIGRGYVGGLVGFINSSFIVPYSINSSITNCSVAGNVSGISNSQEHIGGLVGCAMLTSITNCFATCNVSVTRYISPQACII